MKVGYAFDCDREFSILLDFSVHSLLKSFSGSNARIAALSDLPSLESAGAAWTSLYPEENKYSNEQENKFARQQFAFPAPS